MKIQPINGLYVAMFDFDGTVLDTMEAHGNLAATCINNYFGIPVDRAKVLYYSTTGIPFPKQLKKLATEGSVSDDPEKIRQCAQEYFDRKTEEVYFSTTLFPEIKEMLEMLEETKTPRTISTSTETDLTSKLLQKHGISEYFLLVRGKESGGKPDHIREVRDKYKPKNVIFTGDSTSDVKLNREPGVVTVGKAGLHENGMLFAEELIKAGANYATYDLRDLVEILYELDRVVS